MGIITRFKDIMAANFNALLEKVEDPEKMIDQYLRNLEEDLGEVKKETASVMADEKSVQLRSPKWVSMPERLLYPAMMRKQKHF